MALRGVESLAFTTGSLVTATRPSIPLPLSGAAQLVTSAPQTLCTTGTLSARAVAAVAAFALCSQSNRRTANAARNSRLELVRRLATKKKAEKKGFGSEPKKPSKKPEPSKEKGPKAASQELDVSRRREGSSELTVSKLEAMRERTLAQRRQREADIDEYEEGLATIAKYGPSAAVMPEKVAERAGKRGVVLGGSFYFSMLAVFGLAIFLFKAQDIVIPPTLVAFVTLILLVLAVLGGSYGLMSASWDEDREGSLLGTKEFARNMGIVGDGFRKGVLQEQYEETIQARRENRRLLAAKEAKKRELLNE